MYGETYCPSEICLLHDGTGKYSTSNIRSIKLSTVKIDIRKIRSLKIHALAP